MTKQHGGARQGSGPVRCRFHLSYGAAVLLRELTRSQVGRKDVTEADLTAVLEEAIKAATDRRITDSAPSDPSA